MADYVVIGGGSSGGVVAARLSEDPNTTVTLLEAGGPGNSKFVSIPGMFAGLIQNYKINKLNWRFNTTPQKNLNNRALYNPRGKMLGGSSGMNGMVYIRGESGDYDRWSELGNEGWSYDEVLPYFRKAENNERGADDYHGDSGPLHVSDGDASIDYLVGEPDLVGRGVGRSMISAFVAFVWTHDPTTTSLVVPVNSANERSWRALLRAGFHLVARGELDPDNPVHGSLHEVLRIDRPADAP